MGSCVSKKAAGAGAKGKVAAPLPAVVLEKESAHAQLPPVPEVDAEAEEEEVKEVVLSETPVPPRPPRPPPPEPVKRRREQPAEADDEAASEACSASDSAASVVSSSAAKGKAKPKLQEAAGWEVEKMAVDAPPEKGKTTTARRTAAEEKERERESRKPKGGGVNGHGRARSPSPSSAAHRRQQQQQHSGGQQGPASAAPPRPRREQPAVVSGIGCRSGRFSPSVARRAAESAAAVRRTHSAREADMALPSKRSLSALSRNDPGERSGRRSDSPTGSRRRASAATIHRPASPLRKAAAAKELEHEHGTPERARPSPSRVFRDGVGDEQKKLVDGEEGALGQNPSVAMECFIFL